MIRREIWSVVFTVLVCLLALLTLFILLLPLVGLVKDSALVLLRNFVVLPGISGMLLATLRLLGWVLLFVVPLSFMVALWMYEFARPDALRRLRSLLELLSWMPAVFLGLLGRLLITPLSDNSMTSMVCIMVVFVFPFLTTRFDLALRSVPRQVRRTGFALGASARATLFQLVIPAALWELLRSCVMCVERILGEATALLMLFAAVPQNNVLSVYLFQMQREDSALLALCFGLFLCVLRLLTAKRWDELGDAGNRPRRAL